MAALHAPIVLHYPSSMLIMFNAVIWLSGAMCLWKGGTEDNDCQQEGEKKKKKPSQMHHDGALSRGATTTNKIPQHAMDAVIGLL